MAGRKLTQLGRYQIEDELGRGAMGVVYKALDPVLERPIALKTIALDEAGEEREQYEARFFQEAKAVARLNHPGLITIYDFGEEDDLLFMAMELLVGRALDERMAQSRLDVLEAISIIEQVAEGLAFAHDAGVIHRDIKPGNIMLLPHGRAKIMDFGIARMKQSELKTQIGTRLGTPKYMSPEQIAGGKLDHRSDIFSLGIVLHEMLTGAKLFHDESLAQVMHNVVTVEAPPPSQLNPRVPPLLDLVVKRALQKKAANRYASAWELVDDLRACRVELLAASQPDVAHLHAEDSVDVRIEVNEGSDPTLMVKLSPEGTQMFRRMNASTDMENRLAISSRFDSEEAVNRLQEPSEADRKQLTREPKPPGILRRLAFDREYTVLAMWMLLSLFAAAVLALS